LAPFSKHTLMRIFAGLHEDDVGGARATGGKKTLAVARPTEAIDQPGWEMSELFWDTARQRLPPKIGYPSAGYAKINRPAVGRPALRACSRRTFERMEGASALQRGGFHLHARAPVPGILPLVEKQLAVG